MPIGVIGLIVVGFLTWYRCASIKADQRMERREVQERYQVPYDYGAGKPPEPVK